MVVCWFTNSSINDGSINDSMNDSINAGSIKIILTTVLVLLLLILLSLVSFVLFIIIMIDSNNDHNSINDRMLVHLPRQQDEQVPTRSPIYIYIYIYMYVCMYVCMYITASTIHTADPTSCAGLKREGLTPRARRAISNPPTQHRSGSQAHGAPSPLANCAAQAIRNGHPRVRIVFQGKTRSTPLL